MKARHKPLWCLLPRLFEFAGDGLQVGRQRVTERLFLVDPGEQLGFPGGQEFRELGLELFDPVHRHLIQVAILHGPDHSHLDVDGNRVVLRLFEDFHDALAAVDLRQGFRVEVRTELRKSRQFPKLSKVALEVSRHLLHRFQLRIRANARDRQPDINRRTHALIKQIRFQINLPVRDRDDVGRDVRRNVAGLRFDDRQGRKRAVAILFANPRRSFEQPAVQVKYIAGIGLTTRRPLQHERHLPVGHRVLGQVIIDNQRIHPVVHEPLAHRCAGIRRDILVGGGIRGRGIQDDGVRHRASFLEHRYDPGNGGLLLADRDIDAVERAVRLVAGRFSRFVEAGLVDDRVYADGRLAGRAVAYDQFPLAAANRDHRVNRHDARLHRLVNRPAAGDAGGDLFNRVSDVALDRPFAIDGLAQFVHDASQQALTYGYLQELASGAGFTAFFELGVIPKDDHADIGLFQIQHQAGNAVAQVDHLVEHGVGQAFELGDAIAKLADDADVLLSGFRLRARDLRFDFL